MKDSVLIRDLEYLNTHFLSPTGGFHLIPDPPSTQSRLSKEEVGEEQIVRIMSLKPGSDNALPSPNGVIASNLLLLSSYLEEPSYQTLAKQTIDAFAVEIVQHPFLFVTMLSAVVLEAVGVKSVVAVGKAEVHQFNGFGRTVVRLQVTQGQGWLRQRNQLLDGVKLREGEKSRVMICEAGTCRELKDGELEVKGVQTPS